MSLRGRYREGVTEDARAWGEWLNSRVATRGAGGRMSQAELIRAMAARGTPVSLSTVSRWLGGTMGVGSPSLAAAVGDALGDRAGALAAAGYPTPKRPPQMRELLIVGETVEDLRPYRSRSIDELLAMPHIRIEVPVDSDGVTVQTVDEFGQVVEVTGATRDAILAMLAAEADADDGEPATRQ